MPSVDYLILSAHLLESTSRTTTLADGTVLRTECYNASRGQLDCAITASLNGDNLAMIKFSVYDGLPGNPHVMDFRNAGDGGDPELIAHMMVFLQEEFPGKQLPNMKYVHEDAYKLLRLIVAPDFPAIRRINKAKALIKTRAKCEADSKAIADNPNRTQKDLDMMQRIWEVGHDAIDELRELKRILPDDWEENDRPTITLIKGLAKKRLA